MTLDDIIASFAELTPDAVSIGYSPGPGQVARVVWANAALYNLHGLTPAELLGKSVHSMFDFENHPDHLHHILGQIEAGKSHIFSEVVCRLPDGTGFWGSVHIQFFPRDEAGGRHSVAVLRDTSDLKARERAAAEALAQRESLLQETEALWSRLQLSIDTIEAPMGIWDKDLNLAICNRAFGPRLLGRPVAYDERLTFADFAREAAYSGQFPSAKGCEEEWIAGAIAAARTRDISDIARYSDGRVFKAMSNVASNGDMVVYSLDLTETLAQQAELEAKNAELDRARQEAVKRALRDDLTGLGNRRSVGPALEDFESSRRAIGGELSVLQIDLDRFKQINDTLGHAAGDAVLCAVADRLRRVAGPGDQVARIGGDEFVVLRHDHDAGASARALGERIVDVVGRPVRYHDTDLRIGVSVGMAMTPLSGPSDLMVHADVALYRAKRMGRSRLSVFDATDLEEMQAAKRIGDELFLALERGEFRAWYQPQVDAVTGRLVGLEALARWQHPERGLLTPAMFLRHADDLGILGDIDRAIFDSAIADCTAAFATGPAPDLSFNASEERLMGHDLGGLKRTASAYPGKVSFELLETIFLEDRGEALHFQLDRLRSSGFGIELDDFGSGRASIVALEQIAPDRLKIDSRLVQPVAVSEKSARLVEAIVEIGTTLGIKVTAEGVETEEQARTLVALGCDRLQGYLFGAPMPLPDLMDRFDLRPGRPRSRRRRRRRLG